MSNTTARDRQLTKIMRAAVITCYGAVAAVCVGFFLVIEPAELPLEVENGELLTLNDVSVISFLEPADSGFGYAEGRKGRDGFWLIRSSGTLKVGGSSASNGPFRIAITKPSCLQSQSTRITFLSSTGERSALRRVLRSLPELVVVPRDTTAIFFEASGPGCKIPPDVRQLTLRVTPA